jgi:uncharacterized membrane protein YqaE (UPF0057 family)
MKKLLSLFILSAILVSCGTSNSVVNDGLFQKRKYTSGWFIKKNKNVEKKSSNKEGLAFQDKVNLEKPKNEKIIVKNDDKALEKTKVIADNKESSLQIVKKKETNKKEKQSDFKNAKSITKTNTKNKQDLTINTFGNEKEDLKTESKSENNSNSSSSDVALILLVILCFILPPLAVWLASSDTTQLIISIILTLLFWLPGIIHALLVVLGVI